MNEETSAPGSPLLAKPVIERPYIHFDDWVTASSSAAAELDMLPGETTTINIRGVGTGEGLTNFRMPFGGLNVVQNWKARKLNITILLDFMALDWRAHMNGLGNALDMLIEGNVVDAARITIVPGEYHHGEQAISPIGIGRLQSVFHQHLRSLLTNTYVGKYMAREHFLRCLYAISPGEAAKISCYRQIALAFDGNPYDGDPLRGDEDEEEDDEMIE